MKYFQCDETQFSELKPDLSCVKWWLDYQAAKASLAKNQEKYNESVSDYPEQLPEIVGEILEAADKLTPPTQGDVEPGSDQDVLDGLCRVIHARKKYRNSINTQIAGVIAMYTKVDVETLKVDLTKLLESNKSTKGSANGYKAQISRASSKIAELEEACVKTCLKPVTDEKRQLTQEQAINLVQRFVETWQQRVPLFSVPVSVFGTSIASMEKKDQDLWYSAYKALKLTDLPQRGIYQHKNAEKPKVAVTQNTTNTGGFKLEPQ